MLFSLSFSRVNFSEAEGGNLNVVVHSPGAGSDPRVTSLPQSPAEVPWMNKPPTSALAAIGIIAYLTYFIIRHGRWENSNEIVEDASPPTHRKMKRQLNRSQPPPKHATYICMVARFLFNQLPSVDLVVSFAGSMFCSGRAESS